MLRNYGCDVIKQLQSTPTLISTSIYQIQESVSIKLDQSMNSQFSFEVPLKSPPKILYFSLSFDWFIVSQNVSQNSLCDNFSDFSQAHQGDLANFHVILWSLFSFIRLQIFEPQLVRSFESTFPIWWIAEYFIFFAFEAFTFLQIFMTFSLGLNVLPLPFTSLRSY